MVLKKEVFRLVSMLKDPVLVAFTTSSSEAAYPKTLEQLDALRLLTQYRLFRSADWLLV